MLRAKKSYFVSYSYQTKGSMLVHTKKTNVGLSELRGELARQLKLPNVEIDNVILLDRRSLTDAEKESGATVDPVPGDSKQTPKPTGDSVPGDKPTAKP